MYSRAQDRQQVPCLIHKIAYRHLPGCHGQRTMQPLTAEAPAYPVKYGISLRCGGKITEVFLWETTGMEAVMGVTRWTTA